MQEAADAVAFSAAIAEARGMNIIVLINMVMAAILAVRVALNMLILIIGILAAVFDIIAAIPLFGSWAIPIASALDTAEATLVELDETLTPIIDEALQGLHVAWTAVKDATPALVEATVVPEMIKHYPLISQGLELTPPPALGSFELPVENGSNDKLCKEAGKAVGAIIGDLLGGGSSSGLGKVLGDITSAIDGADPSYFCQLPGTSVGPAPSSLCDTANNAATSAGGAPFDAGEDAGAAIQSACSGKGKTGTPLSGAAEEYSPAQVRTDPPWWNGINDAQIGTALTASDKAIQFANYDPKFAKIAAHGAITVKDPSATSGQTLAFAQAEYFYDQPGAWPGLQDDAMWNYYWRARFRLTRPSTWADGLGTIVDATALGFGTSVTEGEASGLVSKNVTNDYAKGKLDESLAEVKVPFVH